VSDPKPPNEFSVKVTVPGGGDSGGASRSIRRVLLRLWVVAAFLWVGYQGLVAANAYRPPPPHRCPAAGGGLYAHEFLLPGARARLDEHTAKLRGQGLSDVQVFIQQHDVLTEAELAAAQAQLKSATQACDMYSWARGRAVKAILTAVVVPLGVLAIGLALGWALRGGRA